VRDFVHRFEGGPDWLKQVRVDFVAHRENFSIIITWFKIGPRILLICCTCVARVDELLARIIMRAAATALELEERGYGWVGQAAEARP
jgi:hypothetical protein